MTGRAGLIGLLVLLGVGWGLTHPLSKIAVSTGHGAAGLIFWQCVIGAALLGAIAAWRGGRLRGHRRLGWPALGFVTLIALVGTILPNGASYAAYPHLPSGVMSITIAAVPLMALPIAVALGTDSFSALRVAGLLCGMAGVALIALPQASVPGAGSAFWIAIARAAPLFYALEGNIVARWGTAGMDPIEAMAGASAVGALISAPLALASGQWIDPFDGIGAPEWALILSSVIHAFAYAAYVWLVGVAGAVFAAQCSYIVTATGFLWAILLLRESYSGWVWTALGVMLLGIFCVQPRRKEAPGIVPAAAAGTDGAAALVGAAPAGHSRAD